MNLKTQGLILKKIKLNENDALFTILTRDMQKLTAMSKGIRSLKHKDFAALQPFCYSELELSGKAGFYYVSSAQVVSNFYNLRTAVEKVSFATYFAQVAGNLADYTQGDAEYFRFLLNTFYFLENAEKNASGSGVFLECRRLKVLFELRSAAAAGFGPQTQACVHCGKASDLGWFDIENGGAVCGGCKQDHLRPISLEALKIMHLFCYAPMKDAFYLAVKRPEVVEQMEQISEPFLSSKLEYYFQSLDYLKQVAYPSE